MSSRLTSLLYIGNTLQVEVDGLVDQDGSFQNDATVTVEAFVDADTSTAVGSVTLPITMTYVAGSNGQYAGIIPWDAELTAFEWYLLTIRAISSSGDRAQWVEKAQAVYREQ